MAEPIQRLVAAPAKEWLTEGEVLTELGGISSRSLDRYIADGRFFSGTDWGGRTLWPWEAVAWFWLGKKLEVSRRPSRSDDTETPHESPPSDKTRQKAS